MSNLKLITSDHTAVIQSKLVNEEFVRSSAYVLSIKKNDSMIAALCFSADIGTDYFSDKFPVEQNHFKIYSTGCLMPSDKTLYHECIHLLAQWLTKELTLCAIHNEPGNSKTEAKHLFNYGVFNDSDSVFKDALALINKSYLNEITNALGYCTFDELSQEVSALMTGDFRTTQLNNDEDNRINQNKIEFRRSGEVSDVFVDEEEGMAIHNPYFCINSGTVNPVERYGQPYVDWYLKGSESQTTSSSNASKL